MEYSFSDSQTEEILKKVYLARYSEFNASMSLIAIPTHGTKRRKESGAKLLVIF